MRKFLVTLMLATTLVASADTGSGQKKQTQCEQGPNLPRNWEQIGREYVYFDYVLCPADMNPAQPLVRVWITTLGNGFALEKWSRDRDGADSVSVFYGKKKAFTLYRDLNAVPLQLFKAERRSAVPAEISSQPFLVEGTNLVPFENLMSDSAEKVKKVFDSADTIIRAAQRKVPLLPESPRIAAVVNALDKPLKAQK